MATRENKNNMAGLKFGEEPIVANTSGIISETIQTSEVSSLINTKKNAASIPEIVTKGFRFAPPEIRIMIFRECLPQYFTLHCEAYPSLLEALKKDQELHGEALDVYWRNCTFCTDWQGGEAMWTPHTGEIWTPSYKAICNLKVRWIYRDFPARRGRSRHYWRRSVLYKQPGGSTRDLLCCATNVVEFSLELPICAFCNKSNKTNKLLFQKVSMCIDNFRKPKKLKIFTLKAYGFKLWHPDLTGLWCDAIIYPASLSAIDQAFGFQGKRKVECDGNDLIIEAVWEARPGEVLVWSPLNQTTDLWR